MGNFIKKGINVHYEKDMWGDYYIASAFSAKRPPENNNEAKKFYAKNNLGNRIDRLQRDSRKYKTLSGLKRMV